MIWLGKHARSKMRCWTMPFLQSGQRGRTRTSTSETSLLFVTSQRSKYQNVLSFSEKWSKQKMSNEECVEVDRKETFCLFVVWTLHNMGPSASRGYQGFKHILNQTAFTGKSKQNRKHTEAGDREQRSHTWEALYNKCFFFFLLFERINRW